MNAVTPAHRARRDAAQSHIHASPIVRADSRGKRRTKAHGDGGLGERLAAKTVKNADTVAPQPPVSGIKIQRIVRVERETVQIFRRWSRPETRPPLPPRRHTVFKSAFSKADALGVVEAKRAFRVNVVVINSEHGRGDNAQKQTKKPAFRSLTPVPSNGFPASPDSKMSGISGASVAKCRTARPLVSADMSRAHSGQHTRIV